MFAPLIATVRADDVGDAEDGGELHACTLARARDREGFEVLDVRGGALLEKDGDVVLGRDRERGRYDDATRVRDRCCRCRRRHRVDDRARRRRHDDALGRHHVSDLEARRWIRADGTDQDDVTWRSFGDDRRRAEGSLDEPHADGRPLVGRIEPGDLGWKCGKK